jgi:hypothetical protein
LSKVRVENIEEDFVSEEKLAFDGYFNRTEKELRR